jgi:hypothetical protein
MDQIELVKAWKKEWREADKRRDTDLKEARKEVREERKESTAEHLSHRENLQQRATTLKAFAAAAIISGCTVIGWHISATIGVSLLAVIYGALTYAKAIGLETQAATPQLVSTREHDRLQEKLKHLNCQIAACKTELFGSPFDEEYFPPPVYDRAEAYSKAESYI